MSNRTTDPPPLPPGEGGERREPGEGIDDNHASPIVNDHPASPAAHHGDANNALAPSPRPSPVGRGGRRLSPLPVRIAAYVVLAAIALLAIASIDGRAMQLQRDYQASHPPAPHHAD